MPGTGYLSYREWCAEVERLCVARLRRSLTNIPSVSTRDMEEGYKDEATPEEFYEMDIVPLVFPQEASK